MNRLTDSELLELLNDLESDRVEPFDLYPIPTANISDLSRGVFENEYLPLAFAPDLLVENTRSYEERLATCKMIVSPANTTPTLLGLLSMGKSPQDFIPGASIQFLRIDGVELSDPVVDEELIGGAIVETLRRTEEKLKAHNRTAIDVTSAATHNITPDYSFTCYLSNTLQCDSA